MQYSVHINEVRDVAEVEFDRANVAVGVAGGLVQFEDRFQHALDAYGATRLKEENRSRQAHLRVRLVQVSLR